MSGSCASPSTGGPFARCRREPLGKTRALRQQLRRALLLGLIVIGILALVCEGLAFLALMRLALTLLNILTRT